MTRAVRVAHVATIDLTVKALLLPQLVGLRDAGYDVTAISAPGQFVEQVEAAGIRHIPWTNATRAWDPLADVRAWAELAGILRRERFDIVHTHNAKPGVMGRLTSRVLRVPHVVNTVHGFDATPEDPLVKRAAFMGAEWIAARCSDLELYQSDRDLARARRLKMVNGRTGVFLGNGTDLSRFDPASVSPERLATLRKELGLVQESFVVGTIGRLVGEKGYRELFVAARIVSRQMPGVRFLAVGDQDPAKADAITRGEMERARGEVVFASWRDDVPDLLALMDVFVLPSWREGVPRSAIEAAAMGRPMVLSDIPGCRQVARDGVEALLVPVRASDRLAEAILRLLRDPDMRMRMGAAARRRALERFDERRVLATILTEYRRLLSPNGSGA